MKRFAYRARDNAESATLIATLWRNRSRRARLADDAFEIHLRSIHLFMRDTRAHDRNMRPMLIAFDDASLAQFPRFRHSGSWIIMINHDTERGRSPSLHSHVVEDENCIFANNIARLVVNKITSIVANGCCAMDSL